MRPVFVVIVARLRGVPGQRLDAGDEVVLQKPFTEADLSRKVRAVLDHPSS